MQKGLKSHKSTFGLVTNGSEFLFLKSQRSEEDCLVTSEAIESDYPVASCYGLSDLLTLQRRSNDLYQVLSILKRLGQIIPQKSV
jgi:hypothetical protein